MKNELLVRLGDSDVKCILMDGFYTPGPPTRTLHRHNYTEIHVISGARASFELDNREVTFEGFCAFALPHGVMHRFLSAEGEVRHSAFLTEQPLSAFTRCEISESVANDFFAETERCAETGNYARMSALISLLCCGIFDSCRQEATPVTDVAFIVNNFFSVNYNKNVSLADLAAELHYSEKQTARLVQKHTGRTFKRAIVDYRMSVARQLERTTDLPLSEIAKQVGYNSYNGFWRVYKPRGT